MSRNDEHNWDADVAVELRRLASITTSMRAGEMETYLRVLAPCEFEGIQIAVERCLRDPAMVHRPKPGGILAMVPARCRGGTAAGEVDLATAFAYCPLSGQWAGNPAALSSAERRSLVECEASRLGYNSDRVARLAALLGEPVPEAPAQRQISVFAENAENRVTKPPARES